MLLCAGLLLGVDLLLRAAFPSLHPGLVAMPNSAAHYVTDEFDIVAHYNQLGLRGTDLAANPPAGRKRVVALGDSFTFGWGVPDHAAWPVVLEQLLRQQGVDLEVANAGQPGADPIVYLRNAARVIPALRPGLILVGVLQGDDVGQLREVSLRQSVAVRLSKGLQTVLPGMTALAKRLQVSRAPVLEIGPAWSRQARGILLEIDTDGARRYAGLDVALRSSFESGRLNPFLLRIALRHPGYFGDAAREDLRAESVTLLAEPLRGLARLAREAGSELVVVSIPYPVYVSRSGLQSQRSLGFDLDEGLLVTDVPDRVTREASEAAGLRCLSPLKAFREHDDRDPLFFPIDGHLNAAGHRLLAEQIAAEVRDRLASIPARASR